MTRSQRRAVYSRPAVSPRWWGRSRPPNDCPCSRRVFGRLKLAAVFGQLDSDGHPVLAPPNLLRGVPYDGSYLASLVDQLDGPVVLAGHSYGGVFITVSGSSNKVAGLVEVLRLAPDEGEAGDELPRLFPCVCSWTPLWPDAVH